MTNIQQRIETSKQQIASSKKSIESARMILAKFNEKKVYTPFLCDNRGDTWAICYMDQFDNEYDEIYVPVSKLTAFVEEFYSNVSDSFRNGEHCQHVDNTSAYDYLIENGETVLKDFLNNAKY